MSDLKLCGAVIASLVLMTVLKNVKSEYSTLMRLALTSGITVASIALIMPVLGFIEEISQGTPIYSYIPVLMKAVGIALAVEITKEICVDAGEGALGERVCLFGRAEILLISLPLLRELLSLCGNLL